MIVPIPDAGAASPDDGNPPRDVEMDAPPDALPPDALRPDAPPPPPAVALCVLPADESWTNPIEGCVEPVLWFEGPQEVGGQLTRHVSVWNSGPEGSVLAVSAIGVSDMLGGAARFTITLRLFDVRTSAWVAAFVPLELPARDLESMAFPPFVLVTDVSYDTTVSGDVPEESLLITTDAAWLSLPLQGHVDCRPLVVEDGSELDCYGPLCDCCFIAGPDEPPCASVL